MESNRLRRAATPVSGLILAAAFGQLPAQARDRIPGGTASAARMELRDQLRQEHDLRDSGLTAQMPAPVQTACV